MNTNENQNIITRISYSRDYYPNRKMKYEMIYKNNVLDGPHTQWYEGGQIQFRKEYAGGELDGISREWRLNGTIKIMQIYSKNKLVCERSFYENGFPEYDKSYINGEWRYRRWDENCNEILYPKN